MTTIRTPTRLHYPARLRVRVMMLVELCWMVPVWNVADSATMLSSSWMRIDLLVLGSRELSGVISVVLKLAIHVFLQCLPDWVFLKILQMRSKRINREFVAFKLTTSDSALRLTVLHPSFQVRYFSFDILSHMFFSQLTLSCTCVTNALLQRVSNIQYVLLYWCRYYPVCRNVDQVQLWTIFLLLHNEGVWFSHHTL